MVLMFLYRDKTPNYICCYGNTVPQNDSVSAHYLLLCLSWLISSWLCLEV